MEHALREEDQEFRRCRLPRELEVTVARAAFINVPIRFSIQHEPMTSPGATSQATRRAAGAAHTSQLPDCARAAPAPARSTTRASATPAWSDQRRNP